MEGRTLINAAVQAWCMLTASGDSWPYMTFELGLLAAGLEHQGDNLAPAIIVCTVADTTDVHKLRMNAQSLYDDTEHGATILKQAKVAFQPIDMYPAHDSNIGDIAESIIKKRSTNRSHMGMHHPRPHTCTSTDTTISPDTTPTSPQTTPTPQCPAMDALPSSSCCGCQLCHFIIIVLRIYDFFHLLM